MGPLIWAMLISYIPFFLWAIEEIREQKKEKH